MEIVRNADGTLVVPIPPERRHDLDDALASDGAEAEAMPTESTPTTRVLHPGEGGYDEALAEWDHEQNPDRAPVVSTASGEALRHVLVGGVHSVEDFATEVAEAEGSDAWWS